MAKKIFITCCYCGEEWVKEVYYIMTDDYKVECRKCGEKKLIKVKEFKTINYYDEEENS